MTPPALVQVVQATSATGTTTASITPTAGNFLVYIAGAIGGAGANNFSDTSGSNVLHVGTPSVVSADSETVGAMSYVENCAGGTYNVSVVNTDSDPILNLFVCEFSNMPKSGSLLDQGGAALVANPLSGTTQSSNTLVTQFELELLIGMLFTNGNGAVGGGGGAWTTIATAANGFSCCEYQVLTQQSGSGRQFSAPFSTPAGGSSLIGIASFKWSFTSLSVVGFSSP